MERFWAGLLAPLRAAGRAMLAGLVAGFLALTGAVLLLAAGCVGLVPVLGTAWALAVTGLAFLLLAGAAFGLATARPAPPPPPPQPDPLMQVVFDLSLSLGRLLRPRKG